MTKPNFFSTIVGWWSFFCAWCGSDCCNKLSYISEIYRSVTKHWETSHWAQIHTIISANTVSDIKYTNTRTFWTPHFQINGIINKNQPQEWFNNKKTIQRRFWKNKKNWSKQNNNKPSKNMRRRFCVWEKHWKCSIFNEQSEQNQMNSKSIWLCSCVYM